jgi:hypothetical protein
LEHVVVLHGGDPLNVTPELASGQPHCSAGAGEAEIALRLVALVTALWIAEVFNPYLEAYSAPARAAFPTSICCQSPMPKSSIPIAKVASIDAVTANSIVLTPSTPAKNHARRALCVGRTRIISLSRPIVLQPRSLRTVDPIADPNTMPRSRAGSFNERGRQQRL